MNTENKLRKIFRPPLATNKPFHRTRLLILCIQRYEKYIILLTIPDCGIKYKDIALK